MTKQRLIKLLVEKKFLKHTIAWIDKKLSTLGIRMLTKSIPVEKDQIIFITFRSDYDCNAKWICEEIVRRELPVKLVWTTRKATKLEENGFPSQLLFVRRSSYAFFRELSRSKIIIDNGVSTAFLKYKKKPDQILIETWHGSLGIKKFSQDTVKDKAWVRTAFREGKMTDYIISNSDFEDAVYREDYWKKTPIWKYGHARNDILCEGDSERVQKIREKVYAKYELAPDTKICLYAPTFRDDGDLSPYLIDYEALQQALQQRFGGEWVIFTRFHFRIRAKVKDYYMPPCVLNVSDYPDIQELLVSSHAGITDYSSWICDYMLTRRPGFLFATDLEEYKANDRALFYPLDSMPFPLAENNEQLLQNILNFDQETFVKDCDAFLADKGCIDDGHAAERIVDHIELLLSDQKEN